MFKLDPEDFSTEDSFCVVGSTFVDTPRGRMPIKYLKDGDWIDTIDPVTVALDMVCCKNPRLTQRNADLVRVYTDNDAVLCTPNHRFLTYNRGWVEASELRSGDSIVSLYRNLEAGERTKNMGKYVRNQKIFGVEAMTQTEDVYCMGVPNTHTFFANGMAVHNCETILEKHLT